MYMQMEWRGYQVPLVRTFERTKKTLMILWYKSIYNVNFFVLFKIVKKSTVQ